MKPPAATATHVVTMIFTATALTTAYALISVYILSNIDPKFGAAGTVQLLGLMAGLSSGVAAIGSGLFHFLWSKRSMGTSPVLVLWSGAAVGTLVAVVHQPILFDVPVLSGVSDWQQQCVYFVVLGYALHWLSLPLVKVVAAQQAVPADRPKAGSG